MLSALIGDVSEDEDDVDDATEEDGVECLCL